MSTIINNNGAQICHAQMQNMQPSSALSLPEISSQMEQLIVDLHDQKISEQEFKEAFEGLQEAFQVAIQAEETENTPAALFGLEPLEDALASTGQEQERHALSVVSEIAEFLSTRVNASVDRAATVSEAADYLMVGLNLADQHQLLTLSHTVQQLRELSPESVMAIQILQTGIKATLFGLNGKTLHGLKAQLQSHKEQLLKLAPDAYAKREEHETAIADLENKIQDLQGQRIKIVEELAVLAVGAAQNAATVAHQALGHFETLAAYTNGIGEGLSGLAGGLGILNSLYGVIKIQGDSSIIEQQIEELKAYSKTVKSGAVLTLVNMRIEALTQALDRLNREFLLTSVQGVSHTIALIGAISSAAGVGVPIGTVALGISGGVSGYRAINHVVERRQQLRFKFEALFLTVLSGTKRMELAFRQRRLEEVSRRYRDTVREVRTAEAYREAILETSKHIHGNGNSVQSRMLFETVKKLSPLVEGLPWLKNEQERLAEELQSIQGAVDRQMRDLRTALERKEGALALGKLHTLRSQLGGNTSIQTLEAVISGLGSTLGNKSDLRALTDLLNCQGIPLQSLEGPDELLSRILTP